MVRRTAHGGSNPSGEKGEKTLRGCRASSAARRHRPDPFAYAPTREAPPSEGVRGHLNSVLSGRPCRLVDSDFVLKFACYT